jgi:hypothetical protein
MAFSNDTSRVHTRLVRVAGRLHIVDAGSTNEPGMANAN